LNKNPVESPFSSVTSEAALPERTKFNSNHFSESASADKSGLGMVSPPLLSANREVFVEFVFALRGWVYFRLVTALGAEIDLGRTENYMLRVRNTDRCVLRLPLPYIKIE